MKILTQDPDWPESWRMSFEYDQMELNGDKSLPGYYYSYQSRFMTAISMIQAVLPLNSRILDVAAGQGNFSLKLAELGYRVTWNDIRTDLIEYTKLKYEKGDLDFLPGNILDLNFDEKFDLVLITEIIEHVAHPDKFLMKISSLVKNGGYVLLTTPNGAYFLHSNPRFSDCLDPEKYEEVQFKPNSDGHIFLLYPEEIKKLANESGLQITESRLISNFLTCGHLKLRYLLNLLPSGLVFCLENISRKLPDFLGKYIHSTSAVLMKKL